jgi:hypothetical protein
VCDEELLEELLEELARVDDSECEVSDAWLGVLEGEEDDDDKVTDRLERSCDEECDELDSLDEKGIELDVKKLELGEAEELELDEIKLDELGLFDELKDLELEREELDLTELELTELELEDLEELEREVSELEVSELEVSELDELLLEFSLELSLVISELVALAGPLVGPLVSLTVSLPSLVGPIVSELSLVKLDPPVGPSSPELDVGPLLELRLDVALNPPSSCNPPPFPVSSSALRNMSRTLPIMLSTYVIPSNSLIFSFLA